jgi:SAM-dependent methyltransferase
MNANVVPGGDDDDDVRWIEAESMQGAPTGDASADDAGSDDESPDMGDLFADPDPFDTFHFEWTVPLPQQQKHAAHTVEEEQQNEIPNELSSHKTVSITLSGHKAELGQTLHSTGLTLWRASELLCDYMIRNANTNSADGSTGSTGTGTMTMDNKNVLELGAGLGLCGILAHHLQAANVVLTDGDTDALKLMRSNVAANCQGTGASAGSCDANSCDSASSIQCRQLVWGDKERLDDLRRAGPFENGFHLVLGADIIYVVEILEPLFQSVQRLLADGGQFWLAYARRNVKIDWVLEMATRYGFTYETPDDTEGVFIFQRQ